MIDPSTAAHHAPDLSDSPSGEGVGDAGFTGVLPASSTTAHETGSQGPGSCRPGVLLFRGRGLISTAIRWQSRSIYSHAAILMRDGRIVESWQGAGVRAKEITDWSDIDVFDVPVLADWDWDLVEDFALNLCGHGYDYRAVLRFVSRRPASDNDRWFCSELVFAAIESAGVELLSRTHASAVSPGMLALSPYLIERKGGIAG